jgi:protein involved in polysaccharide export with SLBB domain
MKQAMAVGLFALTLLTSCASSGVKNVSLMDAMKSETHSYSVSAEDYRIHAGDELEIKFFYSPELNERAIVRPDGRISLQLAHEIMAAGQTPAELTNILTDRYSKVLEKPEITVIVRTFSNQRIYVDGEVAKPGLLPLVGSMTVLQAISQTGGMKDTGGRSEVLVIRRGPADTPIVFSVDMQKVADGTDLGQDIVLKPYDIVHVPKKTIADVNLWVDQYINRLVPQFGFTYSAPVGSGRMGIDTSK